MICFVFSSAQIVMRSQFDQTSQWSLMLGFLLPVSAGQASLEQFGSWLDFASKLAAWRWCMYIKTNKSCDKSKKQDQAFPPLLISESIAVSRLEKERLEKVEKVDIQMLIVRYVCLVLCSSTVSMSSSNSDKVKVWKKHLISWQNEKDPNFCIKTAAMFQHFTGKDIISMFIVYKQTYVSSFR